MLNDFTAKLVYKKEVAPAVFNLRFKLIEPKEIKFTSGQYVIFLGSDNKYRQYSIASPDYAKDSFELIVRVRENGLVSTYLSNLNIGDTVEFRGPAGILVPKKSDNDKVFLATGCGIAPILSIIESLIHLRLVNSDTFKTNNLYLFWGLRTREDVYFLEKLKSFERQYPNFIFKICLSREENLGDLDSKHFALGRIGKSVEAFLAEQREKTSSMEFYICGRPEMVNDMVKLLEIHNIPKEHIFHEKFSGTVC